MKWAIEIMTCDASTVVIMELDDNDHGIIGELCGEINKVAFGCMATMQIRKPSVVDELEATDQTQDKIDWNN